MKDYKTREEHIEDIKNGIQELLEKHWNNNNEFISFEIRVATRDNKNFSGFLNCIKKTYNPDKKIYEYERRIGTEDYFKE